MAKIKKMTQQDHNQYLIEFVQHLKQLNEGINIDLLDTSIEEILKDPKQYAYDIIELEFAKAIPKFVEAYNAGREFSNANKGLIVEANKRMYVGGGEIDENLPPAYSLGDTLNHPGQECKNCKFYVHTKTGDYCSAWDADVRHEYWCKKWQKVSK
jgi:hypothetical protein